MRLIEMLFYAAYHVFNAMAGICWSSAEILKEIRLYLEGKESAGGKKDG